MAGISAWTLGAALAIGGTASRPAVADDWPQYRGPNRDGTAPGVRLPAVWPARLEPRWQVPMGEGYSSPAVFWPQAGQPGRESSPAGSLQTQGAVGDERPGRVFVLAQEGADEALLCLDAATGKTLWRRSWAGRYSSGLGGTGPRATPAIEEDRVYAVGATGEMRCLAVADGKVLWQKSFRQAFRFRTPTYGLSPSPLIDGDCVVVHTGARNGDSIVAMDKRTGEVVWRSQSDPAGYASPMIVPASETRGPRQLVVFTELGLVSLNPDTGAFYWRYDWTTSYEQNIAQPMLEGDLLVITSLTGCAALRLTKEREKPAVREAWRNHNLAVHFSCPVNYGGTIYGIHGRRGELRAIDVADGSVKWSRSTPTNERAGIVLADGCLLIYTDTGHLIVADASPTAYRERARYQVAGHNWVPPVLAGGCLFLRDDSTLRAIQLPKP